MRTLVAATLIAGLGWASRPADVTRFVGKWSGEGTFQGKAATGAMEWESVLTSRFVRLRIEIALGGQRIFEGHAYYAGTPPRGTWFDSQGASYKIESEFAGDSLVSTWGPDLSRPLGRSVYRLTGTDRMTVTDYLNRSGSWTEFARIEYRRAGSD
jgi:hypothetical protein